MTETNHSQCDWGEGHSEGFQTGVIAERERHLKAVGINASAQEFFVNGQHLLTYWDPKLGRIIKMIDQLSEDSGQLEGAR